MRKILIGMMAAAGLAFAGCETERENVDQRLDTREEGVGGAYEEGGAPDATEVDQSLEEGWENTKEEVQGAGENAQESWNENIEQPAEREMNEMNERE